MADTWPPARLAPIMLSWAKLSAVGMRASNEDAMGEAQQDDMMCFVMSDGAGGHECGEIASALVVDAVLHEFLGESSFSEHAVLAYVEKAIAEVARNKQLTPRQNDMSATVATLLIDQSNHQALWAHLGDTRIYWFRDSRLMEVSKDHSVAQQFIDAGYGQPERLREHPQRNMLFAAVGAEGDTPVAVRAQSVPIGAGDAFLICTDGFWEWVLEADMEQTLAEAATSEQWLDAMSKVADANTSATEKLRDNYSAIAIWVHAPTGGRA
ncbi:MAG: PP2C family serine/threonine-protein phosphatase [Pseudomonadota bacterium]